MSFDYVPNRRTRRAYMKAAGAFKRSNVRRSVRGIPERKENPFFTELKAALEEGLKKESELTPEQEKVEADEAIASETAQAMNEVSDSFREAADIEAETPIATPNPITSEE